MLDLAADHLLTLRDSLTVSMKNGDAKAHKASFKDNPLRKLFQM